MAEHPDEVEEVTETASALLLNMGNISDTKMQSMKIAIETANRLNIPVVIDAVGVACSRMRLSFVKMLLSDHRAAVVKGNYSEIYALYDNKYRASGIDVRSGLAKDDVISAASFLACEYSLITVASGKTDIITDGQEILELNCGCSQMAEVTGTGCMQGAAIAAALSFGVSIKAVADVCEFFGRAGERAATDKGNGTFMVNFINELGICL